MPTSNTTQHGGDTAWVRFSFNLTPHPLSDLVDDLHGTRLHDDAGLGLFLRRSGRKQKLSQSIIFVHRLHGVDSRPVVFVRLLVRLWAGQQRVRLVRLRHSAQSRTRFSFRRKYRRVQSAERSFARLHRLSELVRHHHAGVDQRRRGRTDEVDSLPDLHLSLDDVLLRSAGALVLLQSRLAQSVRRVGFRRRFRRARLQRHIGFSRRDHSRLSRHVRSRRVANGPNESAVHHRRHRSALGRLDGFQRWLGLSGERSVFSSRLVWRSFAVL